MLTTARWCINSSLMVPWHVQQVKTGRVNNATSITSIKYGSSYVAMGFIQMSKYENNTVSDTSTLQQGFEGTMAYIHITISKIYNHMYLCHCYWCQKINFIHLKLHIQHKFPVHTPKTWQMQHLKEVHSQLCSLFPSFSFHTQFPDIIFHELTMKYKILTVSPSET